MSVKPLDGALFMQAVHFTKASRNLLFLPLRACFTETEQPSLASSPVVNNKIKNTRKKNREIPILSRQSQVEPMDTIEKTCR